MKCRCRSFILIIMLVVLVGCTRVISRITPPPAGEALSPVRAKIDFADDLDLDSLDLAISRSLSYYNGSGRKLFYPLAERSIDAQLMKETLLNFRQLIKNSHNLEEKSKEINKNFDIYRAMGRDGSGSVLFTGYYEPLLDGSRTPSERYRYPIYRSPPDLIARNISQKEAAIKWSDAASFQYYSRRDIDIDKVLQGKGLELAWVEDQVDLFFLHIQGSGKIRLENGEIVTVSTTHSNGRPFRSITKHLLDEGIIGPHDASYFNVKRFLKGKGEQELKEILSYNERYIFFRFVDKDPIGSLGEPVTAGRSIATDPDFFPPGALAFVRLSKPVLDQNGNCTGQKVSFSRFVLNQDKGSAIKGPDRVDLFCGHGATAESIAGSIKEKGELYFLIKK